ncbi:MAG: tetratricopeptide repeat protein, partial [Lysobacterales bacterium]
MKHGIALPPTRQQRNSAPTPIPGRLRPGCPSASQVDKLARVFTGVTCAHMRRQARAIIAVSRLTSLAAMAVLIVLLLPGTLVAAGTLPEIRALAADQHYAEALKQLDQFLGDHPDDVEARLFRGVILTRQGNIDEAINTFSELSRDRPELPESLNNLAVLYAAQGRYDDSREVLIRAIELEPRYDTAQENLGDVYAKLADIAYERAFTLNKNNVTARDKAVWMTRVLDTEPASRTGDPSKANAAIPDLETRAAEQIEPKPTSEAETRAIARQIAATCYAINGIENHSAARSVANWFTSRGLTARDQTRSVQESISYEVFVPPFASRAAVDDEIRRMREDGFID